MGRLYARESVFCISCARAVQIEAFVYSKNPTREIAPRGKHDAGFDYQREFFRIHVSA